MSQRKARMTKEQVNQFLQWFFSDTKGCPRYDATNDVIAMYQKRTGITLTNQFVNSKRREYRVVDGQIIRVNTGQPLTPLSSP